MAETYQQIGVDLIMATFKFNAYLCKKWIDTVFHYAPSKYELHGDYGSGYELLCAETSRREALQRKREYMENAPCPLKIVEKRERK